MVGLDKIAFLCYNKIREGCLFIGKDINNTKGVGNMKMSRRELRIAKEERAAYQESKWEALRDFKNVAAECDKAYSRMDFVRSQRKKAEREQHAARKKWIEATGAAKVAAKEEYLISQQVYRDALERYKEADAEFRRLFDEKRYKHEIYLYLREQFQFYDGIVKSFYKNKNPQ